MRIEIAVAALAAAGFGGYSWWTREGRRRRRRRGRGANREEASEEDDEAAGNELLEQLSFAHATNEEAELSKRKAAREISRKMAARERGLQSSSSASAAASASVGAEEGGLPEGQSLAKEWIVMDLGGRPPASWRSPWKHGGGKWRLIVSGGGMEELSVSMKAIKKLGVRTYSVDWHCVTGWSYPGLKLQGVPFDDFISEICKPNQGWTSLMQIGADGYTASVHREDAVGSGAFIAFSDEAGKPIPVEHGGVRVVFPNLYGWKSAKFLCEIRFDSVPAPGFWEKLGCHSRGRWAYGERWAPRASGVWNILAYITDRYRVVFGYATWVAVMTKGGRTLGALVAMARWITGRAQQGRLRNTGADAAARGDGASGTGGRSGVAAHVKLNEPVEKRKTGDGERLRGRKHAEDGGGPLAEALKRALDDGMLSKEWELILRPGGAECLRDGMEVLVEGKKGGRAKLDAVCVPEGDFKGKCRVVYPKGSVYHLSPKYLTPVESGRKIVVVPTTENYHLMARSQVLPGDRVFEVGCDFGMATKIMAEAGAESVCAVDISREHVAAASAEHGSDTVHFEVLDAICDLDGLSRLGARCKKAFVDINGNREIDAVVRCVSNVQRVIAPDIIVVKSVALARALALILAESAGAVDDSVGVSS